MPRGCANEAQKAQSIEQFTKDAAENYAKILTRYPIMNRSDDAKKRLAALHQPIPRPTKAAVALNRAEDASRRESTRLQQLMGLIKKGPDTAQAAKVGEPPLADPEPVSASRVFQADLLGATKSIGKPTLGPIEVMSGQPGANDPAPRSDSAPAGASPFGQPTTPAGAQPPAQDPNELKPNLQPDPNELKPTDSGGDPAVPPPVQVNEIQQGSSSSAATASADNSTPATDQEISSSKKKKKKGMKKVVPF
jgi:outer membrane protein assembly factor BamD